MSIPNKLKNIEIAGHKAQIADLRRIGLAMAIMTQVDVAKSAYEQAKDMSYYREKVYQNDKLTYDILLQKESNNFASQLSLKKAYLNMVYSRILWSRAYADQHIAAALLLESVGLDVVGDLRHLSLPIDKIIEELQVRAKNINAKLSPGKKHAKKDSTIMDVGK